MQLDLTTQEVQAIKQAITFWTNAADHKCRKIHEMMESTPDTSRTVSQKADVDSLVHIPNRIAAGREVLQKITAGGKEWARGSAPTS